MAISMDGKILALGLTDGNVVLYSDVQPVGNLEAIFATGTNTYLNPTTSTRFTSDDPHARRHR